MTSTIQNPEGVEVIQSDRDTVSRLAALKKSDGLQAAEKIIAAYRHYLAREPATADVEWLLEELRPLIDAAAGPNGWDWMFPLRVNPVDGKPTIVSHKGGNLFRGYIGTWQEADLLVALANAAPRILSALSRAAPSSEAPKGFVLTESEADDDCGCPEEMWDTPYGALHMHLSAGKPSNACLDNGDAGEWEITLTADTVEDARRAFFGWAAFAAHMPAAALAATSTPPASKGVEAIHPDDLLTPEDAWQELVEYTDRTSPADYPDMCLITRDELIDFIHRAVLPTPGNDTLQGRGEV